MTISEFDFSIGEDILEGMSNKVIDRQDVSKYLKYAQYMRNRNIEKLEELVKLNEKEG